MTHQKIEQQIDEINVLLNESVTPSRFSPSLEKDFVVWSNRQAIKVIEWSGVFIVLIYYLLVFLLFVFTPSEELGDYGILSVLLGIVIFIGLGIVRIPQVIAHVEPISGAFCAFAVVLMMHGMPTIDHVGVIRFAQTGIAITFITGFTMMGMRYHVAAFWMGITIPLHLGVSHLLDRSPSLLEWLSYSLGPYLVGLVLAVMAERRQRLIFLHQRVVADQRVSIDVMARDNALLRHDDPVTNLPNRRAMDQFLTREWSRSQRQDHKLAFVVFELEGVSSYLRRHDMLQIELFKQVADSFLSVVSRASDFVASSTGHEYMMCCAATSHEEVGRLVERVVESIDALNRTDSVSLLSVRAGGCFCRPDKNLSLKEFVSQADRALSLAQRRNQKWHITYYREGRGVGQS